MTGRALLAMTTALMLAWGAVAACGDSEDGGGTATGSGTGAGTGSGEGGGDWGACFSDTGNFADYDLKICDPQLDECAIAVHTTDCCGTTRYVGVNKNQLSAFDSCEQAWSAHFPPCGCAPSGSLVEQPEDGTVNGIDEVRVECANCTTDTCICVTMPL